MGKEKRPFCCPKIVAPMGCLPLPGAIYMWKNKKKTPIETVKNQTSKKLFKLATNGQSDREFLLTSNFCPQRLSVLALRLYTCIKSFKMCLKSYFKKIVLKLVTNGQSDNINICPQGVVCPCPGAIYMYKSIRLHVYTRTRCQVSVYRTTGSPGWMDP